ncbi:methyl-accepting chemotaxis protein [Sphingomonas sp. HF-S4]|uniref:Methyl-accepting chemotaxis protein n=1 Tax=Sphingomonas agrestis TaxID=3080540 RepID=A0ABU3Y7F5_9SPHN|nr:methyl-accepting chemotaxis protein [Sphingomonas sp. HF-S4]MDV3457330.1 methyl-accepting chemotaxis protein [Sphingomonas sp. HF-S4]
MTQEAIFARFRAGGARTLLALLWLNWLTLAPVALLLGSENLVATLIAGFAVLVLPTINFRRGSHDAAARCALGIAASVFPALFVALAAGRPWQMDLHMYFFVSMSMLLLLCDWRPIVAFAALTALHHLAFSWLLPEWVFPGSGSLGRVALHGGLVVGEAAILIFTTDRIRRLIVRSQRAREAADTARREADALQEEAQNALQELRAAQALSQQRLVERQAAERALADSLDGRRAAISADIEDRVRALAAELRAAAATLAGQENALDGIARRLSDEYAHLRIASDKSLSHASLVSAGASQLSQAAHAAGDNAERANALVNETSETVEALEPQMIELTRQIDGARSILDLVSEIAAQSNLLALNATIEAARSGEAGRGFGVVAQEMKQMAKRTSAATSQIAEKLDLIGVAARSFGDIVSGTTSRMGAASGSARAVSAAVDEQRRAIHAISQAIDAVMEDVSDTDARSRIIGDAVDQNRDLAAHASQLGRLLDDRARALGENMERLLADLRAA